MRGYAFLLVADYTIRQAAKSDHVLVPSPSRSAAAYEPNPACSILVIWLLIRCLATPPMGECNNCGDECSGAKCGPCQAEYDRRINAGTCTLCGENPRNLASPWCKKCEDAA